MSFNGFNKEDFDVFTIDGLDERMEGIREKIQPKFKELGEDLAQQLSMSLGNEMYLHIAKHARRSVNPPKDTWLAVCHNKRGYKKHPHFQVGLFDDHVFVWLAFIYELPNKQNIAQTFLNHLDTVTDIPNEYVISQDHMKKDAMLVDKMNEEDFKKTLERFRDVKKAEFLVGRHFPVGDTILNDGQALTKEVIATYEKLLPLYKLAMQEAEIGSL
ncbi:MULTISPECIES: YktB family protein [Bacillaceae]|uniref:UPF0637 protein KS407_03445 n=1 Tax=Evansella alkalicola TaxID=745819 RepID=A0ABS6JPL8_9BACI|nr:MULTISPECIES: DUF1054 domain-containing protein [Bacillaceae]MBU9720497.1 DUF1054 domain-containing protein [Bacillus alkalicola]